MENSVSPSRGRVVKENYHGRDGSTCVTGHGSLCPGSLRDFSGEKTRELRLVKYRTALHRQIKLKTILLFSVRKTESHSIKEK